LASGFVTAIFFSLVLRRADLETIMTKSAAATKLNNRKIHTRKFLVTPEGKA